MGLSTLDEQNGDPRVQTLEVSDLRLASGGRLARARLGYCVYGPEGAPIVVVHTAVSGNPRAHVREKRGYGDGWWSRHFAPGGMLDETRVRTVVVSHLGGNGPSTTAAELGPERFDLSIVDTAELAARALGALGVGEIHAALGVSMGAAVARHWLYQDHVRVSRIVEVFGNLGNNHVGAVGKEYCHIQLDLLHDGARDLDAIAGRLEANCGPMRAEAAAFRVAYDHTMRRLAALREDPSDEAVLRVTRMIGFFRFVTPHWFQQKWDEAWNEHGDAARADEHVRDLCDELGAVFVRTFRRDSLASLRYMDARPTPLDPSDVATRLVERDVDLMGLAVRGDRLYDPDLQLGHYAAVGTALAPEERGRVSARACLNLLRGHDHFLSPEFETDAAAIRAFLDAPASSHGRRSREAAL